MALSAATIAAATVLNSAAAADPTPPAAGEFVPVAAANLVDSATGVGWSGKLARNATESVAATGVLGVPDAGVLAVMLHITTSNSWRAGANANGNVWAWPTGSARPRYATVANAPLGSVADNTAIVRVGTGGGISFYDGRSGSAVDVTADIEGYVTSSSTPAAGATFAPLTPARIIDTANGTGGRSAPLTAAEGWTFQVLGVGGIPAAGVSAVALNVGARATSTNCWVQVQPAGTEASDAAYPRIDTYANYTAQQLAVVAPDASGNVTFSTNCDSTGLYVDVEGYYLTAVNGSGGDVYVPIANPARVIDTRSNLGITGKITAGRVVDGARAVAVTRVGGVPANADAVALSIGTVNGTARGYNTIWADGTAQASDTSTIDVEPQLVESNLIFLATGPNGKVDVSGSSGTRTAANDLYVDIAGYFYRPAPAAVFGTPQYFADVWGDTFFNTVGTDGESTTVGNDSRGVAQDCTGTGGGDVVLFNVIGPDPANLTVNTTNCMTDLGPIAGGATPGPDGCSWKSGGITRIGQTIYLAIARQLLRCTYGNETEGLQPSFNASIIKSDDGGQTWTNAFGRTDPNGAAPRWNGTANRYQAMFPGQRFTVPFFIQYGPGNTQTADGGDKYLYTVSTDGYAYNGNFLQLARVPLDKIQTRSAWQFYHGPVGGSGQGWTSSPVGATRILQATNGISQPAIQYVPALRRYVLVTFNWTRATSRFPTATETPYSQWRIYTAPKPWGPWTNVYRHSAQRSLWCTASPCQLVQQPGATAMEVGTPDDWLGYYDPALVQKWVFANPLDQQAIFTVGDWKNRDRYPGEDLYRLHELPLDLSSAVR